jgi:hypothetical protein
MARTMKWPPVPINGRIGMVEGVDATNILLLQTLGDLRANPFNDDNISLGNITYKPVGVAKGRIQGALERLRRIVSVESVVESGDVEDRTYTIRFTDRETRVRSEVTIDG